MKILRTVGAVRAWRRSISSSKKVGFVPTMGALHAGHLSLLRRAARDCDVVVSSVFVNPTQFGPNEDFTRYPRPWKKDRALLASAGAHAVFLPAAASMYPPGHATSVVVNGLTATLCGSPMARGPEHFTGVATVVTKLFNIVQPTRAYFGMKDFQQLRVIEQLTSDLNLPVKIVRCPTLREKDGLAMSSRNAYLSPLEREIAPRFHLALQHGRKLLTSQPSMSPRTICQRVKSTLAAHPFRIDYVELVDPVTLQPLRRNSTPALLAAAVFLGKTRLIDNILINP
jgi:pantoate--beta-alanine ligase